MQTKGPNKRSAFLLLSAACLLAFLPLAVAAMRPEPLSWDASLQAQIRGAQVPWLTSLLTFLTWFGITPVVVVTILGLVVTMLLLKRRRLAGTFAFIGILELGNQLLQAIIGRTRPDPLVQATNDSFPSGHAFHFGLFGGFMLYLLLARLQSTTQRVIACAVYGVIVIAIGFSRVYLGFHWPIDVVGGYLLAVPAFGLTVWLHQRAKNHPSERKTS